MPVPLFLWEASHLVAAEPSWLLYKNVTLNGQNRADYGIDFDKDVPLQYFYFEGGIRDNWQLLVAIKTSCSVIFSGFRALEPCMHSSDCLFFGQLRKYIVCVHL